MNRWFRFYDEILDDPKVQQLPAADFKHWVNLLALASRNDGKLPAVEAVAFALRIDVHAAATVLSRLADATLLDRRQGGAHGMHYAPHNWDKRQYKSDGSTDRVKRFRQRSKTVSETPPDTDTDSENGDDGSAGVREADFDAVKLADEAARAAGVRHVDPSQIVRHGTLVREWLQAGADPPAILAAIRDNRAKPDAPPITSLKYFDAEIRRNIASKEAQANGHSQPATRQSGGNPAPPSGRLGAVLELLAEVRAANSH